MAPESTEPFHLLYLCQANQCRSVMAEMLFRQLATNASGAPSMWEVSSAGVTAHEGVPLHPTVADVLAERGGSAPTSFRSRRLRAPMIEAADLVLTAERSHRAAVAVMDPSAVNRVFTMRQFARLVDGVEEEGPMGGHQLIERALARRGLDEPPDATTDDIRDPIGQGHGSFRKCADDITDSFSAFGLAPERRPAIPEQRRAGIFRRFRSRTA